MKKNLLVAAGFAVAALAPMSAFAIDGTINISGQVTATTCQINGGTSPRTITVVLPNVSTTSLNSLGATAGNQPFSINLTGCASGTRAVTYFEPGPTVDAATGDLRNTTGSATNVQVRLLNSDMSIIEAGATAGSQNSQEVVTNASGAGSLNYYAQYVATAASVNAGTVVSSVQFTMQYQ